MPSTDALTARSQDYLEAILEVAADTGVARVRDIARKLRVRNSTVTGAMRKLADEDLVNYNPYEVITLTSRGEELAREVARRHRAIRRFLTEVLGLGSEKAEANACRMEHAMGDQALERLVKFIDFVEDCPRGGSSWTKRFVYYCEHGLSTERCEECVKTCRKELSQALRSLRQAEK
jgi:DtxR family Mn-dependent transcriptional regulator